MERDQFRVLVVMLAGVVLILFVASFVVGASADKLRRIESTLKSLSADAEWHEAETKVQLTRIEAACGDD